MRVSVVIPTIGRESLQRAVDSVLSQNNVEVDIIVVDDSEEQDIIIKSTEVLKTGGGRGVSYARNLGIGKSSNEFVAFMDDDDYWNSDHLEKLIFFLNKNQLDIAISSAIICSNQTVRPKIQLEAGRDPFELIYGRLHFGRSKGYLPTAGYLVKQELARDLKFNESLIDRENLDFLHRAFSLGARIAQSSVASLNIDYAPKASLSRANLESEIMWLKYLRRKNSKFARNFKIESVRNFLRVFKLVNATRVLFS